MTDIKKYNPEDFDDKAESYILTYLFKDDTIIDKVYDISELLYKKHRRLDISSLSVLKKLHSSLGFKKYSSIGKEKNLEINMFFFGTLIRSKFDLIDLMKGFSDNIEGFRGSELGRKGLVFYFIEHIVEYLVDIDDKYYDFFINHSDKKDGLYKLISGYVIDLLEILEHETDNLLNRYNDFIDKYISRKENYLNDRELKDFKVKYVDLVNHLMTDISHDMDIKTKVKKIEKEVSSLVTFEESN